VQARCRSKSLIVPLRTVKELPARLPLKKLAKDLQLHIIGNSTAWSRRLSFKIRLLTGT